MAKPVFTTKSSTIHKVDYNEKEKTMEIEFRSGNVYRYYDVPPRMWKIFQLYIECEGSAGSFFNEYIKNQFTSEKLHAGSADDEECLMLNRLQFPSRNRKMFNAQRSMFNFQVKQPVYTLRLSALTLYIEN